MGGTEDRALGASRELRMINCIHKGDRPKMSERGINSCSSLISFMPQGGRKTHMPHITAYLSNFYQEIEHCHPFAGSQSCFSGKTVKMHDEFSYNRSRRLSLP